MIMNSSWLHKLCSTVVVIVETTSFFGVPLWKGPPKNLMLKFNHPNDNMHTHLDSTICDHVMHLHLVYQSACQVYFTSHLLTWPHYTSTLCPFLNTIIMEAVANGAEVVHYWADKDHLDCNNVKVLNTISLNSSYRDGLMLPNVLFTLNELVSAIHGTGRRQSFTSHVTIFQTYGQG